jgi:acyl carrier protein
MEETMGRSRTELLELFQATATEIVEKEFKNIQEATVISELGIDSLGMLEIVGAMERQLKIQIPDEMLAGIQTVKDLVDAVEKRQAS